MSHRTMTVLTGAAAALMLTLSGCSLDRTPTAGDPTPDAVLAEVPHAGPGIVVSFLDIAAPSPAGKTMGADEKGRERAEKDREKAEKDKEKAEKDKEKAEKDGEKDREKAEKDREKAEKDREKAEKENGREQHQAKGSSATADDGGGQDNDDYSAHESPLAPGTGEVSAFIGPEGGKLEFVDRGGPGGNDDVMVRFIVPAGSLTGPVPITMTVTGRTLSTLEVAFGPSDTQFDPPAILKIHLGKDLVDLDLRNLTAQHTYGDGSFEDARMSIDGRPQTNVTIDIAVFGFSRYSLGN